MSSTASSIPSSPAIKAFILRLKRRQIGKYQRVVGIETVHQDKDQKICNLISQIKALGKRLTSLQPHQLSLTKIIRRILKIIREEVADHLQQQTDRLCPPSLLPLPQTNVSSFSVASANCTPQCSQTAQFSVPGLWTCCSRGEGATVLPL